MRKRESRQVGIINHVGVVTYAHYWEPPRGRGERTSATDTDRDFHLAMIACTPESTMQVLSFSENSWNLWEVIPLRTFR